MKNSYLNKVLFNCKKDSVNFKGIVNSIKSVFFTLTLLLSFESVAQCTHTIRLTDTWGDGWNGGAVSVTVNGVTVLSNITLASGAGPLNFNFTASTGDAIRVIRTIDGSFPSEMRIRVINNVATVIIANTQPLVAPGNLGTASCAAAENTLPASGNNAYTLCSGTIYDNGGSGGNYNNGVNGYSVINPSTAGNMVQLTGNINTESGYDYVRIYDGAGIGGTLLYIGSGNTSIGTITSTTGPLTVRLTSDGGFTYSGFALNIACVSPPDWKAQFISMNTGSSNWCEGETRTVSVTVKNNGLQTWTNSSPDINIGVKWNAEADYFVRVDANGLAPGATQTYSLTVTAPSAGTNNLTFDVVNEGNCWFGNNSGSCGPGNVVYTSPAIIINPPPSAPSPVTASPTVICLPDNSNLSATSLSSGLVSGFSDYYAPGNWAVTHNPITDYGTVNTSGAPNSVSLTSSDGGNVGAHSVFFTITMPASGNVTFTWTYATTDVDGPAFDLPQYAINGVIIDEVCGFNPNGSDNQSGSCTVAVSAGQTFSFVMTAMDDILGPATTVFSNFTAPGPTGANIIWYTVPTGGSSIGSSASGANFPVTPGTTTTYYAEALSLAGCVSTPRIPVTVTVDVPSIAPSTVVNAGNYCIGNTVTLSQSGGTLNGTSNYQWYTGSCGGTLVGTGSSITVSPSSSTTYYVGASANGACPATLCANGAITLPTPGTALGLNNESATCPVADNNWVHFYHSSGRLLASINSGGQNLGNVTVTSYVDGTNQSAPDCLNAGAMYETAMMQRHWVITPSIQPSSPVTVKLPFYDPELSTLSGVANSNANLNDDVFVLGDILLDKYAGPLNVNSNALDNCPGTGGSGGITTHSQTANGPTTAYSSVTGAYYTDFSIPGFSEFWLHGFVNVTPLPVTLNSLTTTCSGNDYVKINWITQSENNSSHYVVESSLDGQDWKVVGSVNAAGNSTDELSYQLTDLDNRGAQLTYYRLIQFDLDGNYKVYGPVSTDCESVESGFDVFPNPSSSEVTISLYGLSDSENSQISFCDVNGKEIKRIHCGTGSNQMLLVDISELSTGCYIIRLFEGDENHQNIRWIKQ